MSDTASKTKILGLPVFPSDTSQLASGSILTYDLANRQFKFIPGGGVAGVSSLNGLTGALTLVAGTNISLAIGASTITISASGGGGGTGTVTSIGLAVPGELNVTGSPVTTAGTITIGKATQTANTVWAGPTTGAAAQPTFRALVSADIPGGAATFADEEIPSGSTPGTAFSLANAPNPVKSLLLFWNGLLQKPGGVDYTLAGTAITTVNTIGAGDSFLAWYRF
jgi:hypothetical protein